MQCYEGKDFPSFDICQIQNIRDPRELYEICQFIPAAAGFNSSGWIKFYIPDNQSFLKDEPNCNLYKISRPFVKMNGKMPEIWSATIREDVKEILKAHFESIQFTDEDLLKKMLTSQAECYLIMQDHFELVDGFLEKLGHAMGCLPAEWDILSLSSSEPMLDDFPKVLPIVGGLKGGFVINKGGAEKLLDGNPVRVVSTFPHLIRIPGEKKKENIVGANSNYEFFHKDLTKNVMTSDISTFKTWDCLGKKGLWIYVPDDYLANTNYDKNLKSALARFDLSHLRDPLPNSHTKENGTDAIIVRHAGDFANAHIDLTKYDHIFEVGAGYGALANVILSSGYTGSYTIFDFKLMENVFRRYIQHPFNFIHDPAKIESKRKTLLISTWGISEMPTDLAIKIVKAVKPDGLYVIAQNLYDGRDNIEAFSNLFGVQPEVYDTRSSKFIK